MSMVSNFGMAVRVLLHIRARPHVDCQHYLGNLGCDLGRSLQVAVIGGGAGGVELALALQYRLHRELQQSGQPAATKVHVK